MRQRKIRIVWKWELPYCCDSNLPALQLSYEKRMSAPHVNEDTCLYKGKAQCLLEAGVGKTMSCLCLTAWISAERLSGPEEAPCYRRLIIFLWLYLSGCGGDIDIMSSLLQRNWEHERWHCSPEEENSIADKEQPVHINLKKLPNDSITKVVIYINTSHSLSYLIAKNGTEDDYLIHFRSVN